MILSEKEVETYLVRKCKQHKLMCIKFTSKSLSGLPDRLILGHDALVTFIELKSSIGKVRPLQEYIHLTLRAKGFEVLVINSKQGVDEYIKRATASAINL